MKFRSACFCACHRSGGKMMHMVPCCRPDRPRNPDDFVMAQRKSDGKYLSGSGTSIGVSFFKVPQPIKSRAAAEALIRVEAGADVNDFEIRPFTRNVPRFSKYGQR